MKARRYDSGPPCSVCGSAKVNVVHDDLETRTENMLPGHWAEDRPEQPGGYYVWADITYHPFTTERTSHVPLLLRGHPMTAPTTEAGKALLLRLTTRATRDLTPPEFAIAAIEAEFLDRLAAGVRAIPSAKFTNVRETPTIVVGLISRAAVLALIEEARND